MNRKLVLAAMVAALLLPVAASPVAAVSYDACDPDIGYWHQQVVDTPAEESTTSIRGVKANVWSASRIHECTEPPADSHHATSYWLSIIPAPGNVYYNDPTAILQIGVINCDEPGTPVCDGNDAHKSWVFYAKGGCVGYLPFPVRTGTALADLGGIDFQIERQTSPQGSWYLSYVGSVHFGGILISGTDPATSCWASGSGDNVSIAIACERHDTGDGCGVVDGGNKVTFQDMQYQNTVGGSWHNTTIAGSGECSVTPPPVGEGFGWCDSAVGGLPTKVQFWTTQ